RRRQRRRAGVGNLGVVARRVLGRAAARIGGERGGERRDVVRHGLGGTRFLRVLALELGEERLLLRDLRRDVGERARGRARLVGRGRLGAAIGRLRLRLGQLR